MPERRMAWVSVAFAAGILGADLIGWSACLLVVLCAAILAFVFAPLRFRPLVLFTGVLLLAGAARYSADRSVPADDISRVAGQVSAVEGVVISDITSGGDSLRLTFRVRRARSADGWRKASGDLMMSVYPDRSRPMLRVAFGDQLRIAARPYCPSEPTNPGQFSWKAYLARHGIYACASVRDADQVEVLKRDKGRHLTSVAFAAKRALVSSIFRVHPRREADVMSGVVLGSYAYVDEQTLSDFTRTGTMHVLAASGYNCFVLVLLATPLLIVLRLPSIYRKFIIIALIGFYLLMVGPMPSLIRAAVMAILVLLAVPLRRIADYTNLFYVAGLAVLMLNPSNLFDVGFQLSFLAVGALIYVIPMVGAILRYFSVAEENNKLGWNRRAGKIRTWAKAGYAWLRGTAASTAVATIAVGLVTGPVVAYYFNYISLTSLPANLVVAIVTPMIFFDSFLSPLTSLLPHGAHYAGIIGTVATRIMLWTVSYFGAMRYSSISVQSPGILAIVGYYLLLYAGGGYVRSRFGKG